MKKRKFLLLQRSQTLVCSVFNFLFSSHSVGPPEKEGLFKKRKRFTVPSDGDKSSKQKLGEEG
jgi:hypothetical protein